MSKFSLPIVLTTMFIWHALCCLEELSPSSQWTYSVFYDVNNISICSIIFCSVLLYMSWLIWLVFWLGNGTIDNICYWLINIKVNRCLYYRKVINMYVVINNKKFVKQHLFLKFSGQNLASLLKYVMRYGKMGLMSTVAFWDNGRFLWTGCQRSIFTFLHFHIVHCIM
jgi:hypothetical protein